ncbi:MAG: dual OB domain-containing protein [Phycisphaerales bacterium]
MDRRARTQDGRNDRIPLAQAKGLTSSLRLIRLEGLTLSVFKPGEAFGNTKRRVQSQFEHHGAEHRLWVTEPNYEREYLQKPDGDYNLGESFVTVSLGEPHNEYCYKLVAAIMERARS